MCTFQSDSEPIVIAINVLLDTSAAAVVHLYGAHNYCDSSAPDDLELRSSLDPGGM